jgi:hypothetical protein
MTTTRYAWMIDTEYLHDDYDDENKVTSTEPQNIWGPSDAPGELMIRLSKGEGQPFKLYDDDGLKNLSGKILVQEDGQDINAWDADEVAAFGPLNDYGMPGYGCTELRYPMGENRKWVTL